MDTRTRYNTAQCAPGNRVRILTSEREIDPNTYKVKEFDRQLAILVNLNTSKEVKVHKSRIVQNLDAAQENTDMVADNTAATNPAADAADTTVDKSAKVKRKTAKRVKLDVKALATAFGAGCEHYIMKIESFDHKDIEARAHALIMADHRSVVTFNTYDGSLGRRIQDSDIERIMNAAKKGNVEKPLKSYDIDDDAEYTKKVEKLRKDGFVKRPT